jgi:hypothetical protein
MALILKNIIRWGEWSYHNPITVLKAKEKLVLC